MVCDFFVQQVIVDFRMMWYEWCVKVGVEGWFGFGYVVFSVSNFGCEV